MAFEAATDMFHVEHPDPQMVTFLGVSIWVESLTQVLV